MLIFPTKEYKAQLEEYVQEFIANGETEIIGDSDLFTSPNIDEWFKKIEFDLSEKTIKKDTIPSTIYLTIRKSDNKIIGNMQIKHYLNESLFFSEGHIKNSIRPSERNKSYSNEQMRLGLEKCKELGIERVFIGCDKNNIAAIKSIIKNGGILENEITKPNGQLTQKYCISLKKRYANRHKLNRPNSDLVYLVKNIKTNSFTGDICYYDFKNANIKISTPKGKVIIDNNYKLLEFYDYNSKVKLSAFYDKNNEIIEWYFDIAKKIGKQDDVPYEDDLYLDIVVKPDGKIILLDETELEKALQKFEITKFDYEMAYNEANKLIKFLNGKQEKLKNFTDYYLNYFKEYSFTATNNSSIHIPHPGFTIKELSHISSPLSRTPLKCGIVPHPLEFEDLRQFYVLLTTRCNANCPYCIEPKVNSGGFMSESAFIDVLEQAKALDMQILYLHGGEPTIHPQVVHFAQIAKQYGFNVRLFTNGIRMDILRKLDGIVDEIRFSYEPGREYIFQNQSSWKSRIKCYIMATTECYPTEDSLMSVVHRALDLGMSVKIRTLNPVNQYAYDHQFVSYLHNKILNVPNLKLFCDGNKIAYKLPGFEKYSIVIRLGNMQLNPGHLKFSSDVDGIIHDHFEHSDKQSITPDSIIEEQKESFELIRQKMINL